MAEKWGMCVPTFTRRHACLQRGETLFRPDYRLLISPDDFDAEAPAPLPRSKENQRLPGISRTTIPASSSSASHRSGAIEQVLRTEHREIGGPEHSAGPITAGREHRQVRVDVMQVVPRPVPNTVESGTA